MQQNVVIVADDNTDTANMLAAIIRIKSGSRTLVAYDGAAAVSLALAERPSVVILDLNMPVMDGAAAAASIRTSLPDDAPLLICLSGNLESMGRSDICSMFDHALSKPVNLERLMGLLANAANS